MIDSVYPSLLQLFLALRMLWTAYDADDQLSAAPKEKVEWVAMEPAIANPPVPRAANVKLAEMDNDKLVKCHNRYSKEFREKFAIR